MLRKIQEELEKTKQKKLEEENNQQEESGSGNGDGSDAESENSAEHLEDGIKEESALSQDMSKCEHVEEEVTEAESSNLSQDVKKLSVSEQANERSSEISSKNDSPKVVLPPLFARTDPDTLLARLNTRRLHQRLVHYKKEQRKKREQEALNVDEKEGESIIQMYDRDLKEKIEAERLYPKNVTVEQMAELEWENLLEMAKLRYENFVHSDFKHGTHCTVNFIHD